MNGSRVVQCDSDTLVSRDLWCAIPFTLSTAPRVYLRLGNKERTPFTPGVFISLNRVLVRHLDTVSVRDRERIPPHVPLSFSF